MKRFLSLIILLSNSIIFGGFSCEQLVKNGAYFYSIDKFTPNDVIINLTYKPYCEPIKILKSHSLTVHSYLKIRTTSEVFCGNPNQLFFVTQEKLRPASLLTTNDHLYIPTCGQIKILSIEQVNETIELIELHLNHPHVFLVGKQKILVHNPAMIIP